MNLDSEVLEEMRQRWPKLTQEQLDQAESLYMNLEVIVNEIFDQEVESKDDHCLGLDMHLNDITNGLLAGWSEVVRTHGPRVGYRYIFDTIDAVFKFGHKVGQLGWPLPKLTCEEVHGD